MRQRGPAPEYARMLASIERLARDQGRLDLEIAELRIRAARLEARVADLRQTATASPRPAMVEPEPVLPVPPLATPPQPEQQHAEPGQPVPGVVADVRQPAQAAPELPAEEEQVALGSPVFTRIVVPPAVTPPVGDVTASEAADAVDAPGTPVMAVEAPVEAPVATHEEATEPIWSRIPQRYRRAAWLTAPIVVVLVVSTWISSADSPDPEPTVPSQSGAGLTQTPTALVSLVQPTATLPSGQSSATSDGSGLLPATTVAETTGPTGSGSPTPGGSATNTQTTGTPAATNEGSTPGPATATTTSNLPAAPATATPTTPPASPSEPAAAPTPAAPVELVPGGVGSTEIAMVSTFGEAAGEQDGRTSYSEGSVLVTYGADSRAVRVTFVLDVDEFTISLEEAETLAAYYRPPDAQLLTAETTTPGLIRRVYSSPTLAALFAGVDTGGRQSDRYVEEIHFDPATQRALKIEMALGDRP